MRKFSAALAMFDVFADPLDHRGLLLIACELGLLEHVVVLLEAHGH
jgi:hypothetical protein